MLKRSGALAIALAMTQIAFAAGEEWGLMTDTRNVRTMVEVDDMFWLATEGGLVEFSPDHGSFRTYSTLDGLSGVGVRKLATDSVGGIWLAFDNKMLQRWDPELGVTHSVSALADQTGLYSINDMKLDRRGIFLATNRGVALVNYVPRYDQWVWYQEFRRIGSFSPDIPVNAVLVQGDNLWVTTDEGIARGDLNSPAPLDWRSYTMADGLLSNIVRQVILYRDTLYASTAAGLSRLEGERWRRLMWRADVYALTVHEDTLCAVTSDGISWWSGSDWQRYGARMTGTTGLLWDRSGWLWASLVRDWRAPGGLAKLTDTTWQAHIPTGPTTNYVKAIAFKPDGSAWFTGGTTGGEFGVSSHLGGGWRRWCWPDYSGSAFSAEARSIAFDLDGGTWFGTFNGGVGRITEDTVYSYNATAATGAHLRAYTADGSVLAPAVATDQKGNVWIANRGADNGNVLACVPRSFIQNGTPSEWVYFHQYNFGVFSHFDLLAIDGRDRIWMASTVSDQTVAGEQGVYILDTRGTLSDSTDDRIWGPIPGLPTREVLSLKYDSAGYMWVGSSRGAYYTATTGADLSGSSFSQVYYMRDIPISCIDIDPAGNKWFGSAFGISIVAPDNFTILRRITADPPDRLPEASVQSLAVDPHSGLVYMGVRGGTATLKTPYRDYGQEIAELTFEPNPFNPADGKLVFTGNSLGGNGEVRIFTPDGRLVRKFSHDAAALGWDGRDDSGRDVAEGVYLIVAYNGGGDAATGKVAVLR